MTGTKMTHVTYRGSVPALNDVVAGHIDFMFCDFASAAGMLQGDKVRPLGVTHRGAHPGVSGYPADQRGRRAGLRRGGLVHGGDDRQDAASRSVDRLHGELKAILAKPEVKEQIVKLSLLPMETQAGARDAGVREVGDRALGQGGGAGRDRGIAVAADSRLRISEDDGNAGTIRCRQHRGEIMIILVRCAAIMAAAIALIQHPVGACRRLSEPPGHHDRAVGAGRRGRYHGAHHRAEARRAARQARHDRESRRRRFDARHRDRGQGRA